MEIKIDAGLVGEKISRKELNSDTTADGNSFTVRGSATATKSALFFDTGIQPDRSYQYTITRKSNQKKFLYELITIPKTEGDDESGYYFGKKSNDSFSEILTHQDMVSHFLWGLPQRSSSGEDFEPAQVRQTVKNAAGQLESRFNMHIFPQNYTTEMGGYSDSETYIKYLFDRTYFYYANHARRIQLARRTLIQIDKLKALDPLGQSLS